jgi:hypothetical protein
MNAFERAMQCPMTIDDRDSPVPYYGHSRVAAITRADNRRRHHQTPSCKAGKTDTLIA